MKRCNQPRQWLKPLREDNGFTLPLGRHFRPGSDSRPADRPGPRLYNLAAAYSEKVRNFLAQLEKAFGKPARIELKPGPPGDMAKTSADITDTMRDFDWQPKVGGRGRAEVRRVVQGVQSPVTKTDE
jgi:hypothetical protein